MACGRIIRDGCVRLGGLILLSAILAAPLRSAPADPVKATVTATVSDGYARLVFNMSDYVEGSVRQAGNVLIISFKQPINISVERLATQAPDYIGAARRDPDGKAVRLALARKVTVNAMAAGEKYFVDLLPEDWRGVPPGLPQDVVAELARRAREAEKLVERERRMAEHKKNAPVHVHVATQPTFTRYVFDVPDQVSVSADRAGDRLTLTFDAPLRFDLGDVEAALPRAIGEVNSELEDSSSVVRFHFLAKVDLRTFRDEKGYVVDVVGANAKPDQASETPPAAPQEGAAPQTTAPATTPAEGARGAAEGPAPVTEPPRVAAPAAMAAPASQAPAPSAPSSPEAVAAALSQLAAQPATPRKVQPTPTAPTPSAPPRETKAPDVAPQAASPAGAPAPAIPTPAAAAPGAAVTTAATAVPLGRNAATDLSPPPAAVAAAGPTPKPSAATRGSAAAHTAARGGEPHRVAVDLARQGANLKLSFAFMAPTAAAVFRRADTLWIVFDSKADIDLSALEGESSRTIRAATFTHAPDADIVRIKLDRPHLASVAVDGPVWIVEIGDSALEPTRALDLTRNLIGPNRSSVSIAFQEAHALHRITDPEIGDQLLVATGFAPARGFIHTQDFIEFRALASEQGVVVVPLADDTNMELAPDKVVVSRPHGLTLSSSLQALLRGGGLHSSTFDSQIWGFDREASYIERQSNLIAAAAAAPENKRLGPRLDLARFYLARDMYPEAKGVLDVVLAEQRPAAEDVSAMVLRAVAKIMMNRPADALKDLSDPAVGDQHDAPLWRALAYARQGKWAQAREAFKTVEAAVATLPIELQRVALKDEMRAAIEVGDFAGAENHLNDLQTIGVPHAMQPAMSVLVGRLDEGLGRTEDALAAYRTAADSWDRPAAAQGKLRETALRYTLGDLKREDVISELESLTTVWRGDETEIEALRLLARLYTDEGRYRDSFYVMRSAMMAHPDWDMTRRIQEEAAKTFDALFLAGKGDSMSAIDALALFYDFRELTPIGSRGDEMIRRLADRLVSVDLLDQAADLLQYQVDHRLQGAARAQVATRLAVIYLMNRKADRALAILRATRTADLSTELRNQRLLLEARALSDLGRHDFALEVIASVEGREAIRLRSDILWAARQWSKSAEQIELMYGERWKQWQPLTDVERSDILRAEIGYALGEDTLGLARFREKYAAKMAGTPDARAFEIVSAPLGTSGAEFAAIAHAAASVDTLDDFLREMKARYPDSDAISAPSSATPAPPSATPAAPSPPTQAAPSASTDTPPAPSSAPTPPPPPRAAGRTALR